MSTETKKRSLDDYDEVMETKDVREYLNLSRDKAYELMNSGKFHVVQSGRSKLVAREVFRSWLHGG
ncbi:helix-turn-helix domain-containing protein [Paenibacillus pabuli]|uniref:helix-turn-helix domain-containing protein n=1 Tax=Paenibacillus pabuli TaxID=1472 RepID=UPI001FFF927F|nr:helix-turn-helix domain-containing protein [Paenibacillus pabuli]UPK45943.1 helix-turn-helix domain-containing protein [Paenibacillus pabuli]